jgi:hypothetical protein
MDNSFDYEFCTISGMPTIEKIAQTMLWQLNNNLILQLDDVPVHFAPTLLGCFFFICFVRLLALRPLLAYCASLG